MQSALFQIAGNPLGELLAVFLGENRAAVLVINEVFHFLQVEREPGHLEHTRTTSVTYEKPGHFVHHVPPDGDFSFSDCTIAPMSDSLIKDSSSAEMRHGRFTGSSCRP